LSDLQIDIPEKLGFLFEPHRYKVAYGGRGGGKSWAFADALLIQGLEKPLRIGCFREIQKSIKDSVHKLLADRIKKHGLGKFYEVQQTVIKGANGTEILFAGLQDHTVDSIKSYEGIDRAWVEEGQTVSKRSWDILVPTIRKDGSEIWISFNPELDTDETWTRFVASPPTDSVVVSVNYKDNPWFPSVLEQERQDAQAKMPKADYENIWEGKCRPAVSGAIYADEVAKAQEDGRFNLVPYDPTLKAHVVFDLGWNDKMSIGIVQRHASSMRIVKYIEDDHKTLDWYSMRLRELDYNWGKVFLPHDGAHGDYKTGKSAKQWLEGLGWKVEMCPNQPVETGIKNARMAFGQLFIDKTNCARLIECLKRYRRTIPSTTGEAGGPLHDEWSHGADMFRYAALCAPQMTNDADDVDWASIKQVSEWG
jgi:phage terminase large subunit